MCQNNPSALQELANFHQGVQHPLLPSSCLTAMGTKPHQVLILDQHLCRYWGGSAPTQVPQNPSPSSADPKIEHRNVMESHPWKCWRNHWMWLWVCSDKVVIIQRLGLMISELFSNLSDPTILSAQQESVSTKPQQKSQSWCHPPHPSSGAPAQNKEPGWAWHTLEHRAQLQCPLFSPLFSLAPAQLPPAPSPAQDPALSSTLPRHLQLIAAPNNHKQRWESCLFQAMDKPVQPSSAGHHSWNASQLREAAATPQLARSIPKSVPQLQLCPFLPVPPCHTLLWQQQQVKLLFFPPLLCPKCFDFWVGSVNFWDMHVPVWTNWWKTCWNWLSLPPLSLPAPGFTHRAAWHQCCQRCLMLCKQKWSWSS